MSRKEALRSQMAPRQRDPALGRRTGLRAPPPVSRDSSGFEDLSSFFGETVSAFEQTQRSRLGDEDETAAIGGRAAPSLSSASAASLDADGGDAPAQDFDVHEEMGDDVSSLDAGADISADPSPGEVAAQEDDETDVELPAAADEPAQAEVAGENDDQEEDAKESDDGKMDLVALQARYKELTGKRPTGRWGKDVAWLTKKIAEAEAKGSEGPRRSAMKGARAAQKRAESGGDESDDDEDMPVRKLKFRPSFGAAASISGMVKCVSIQVPFRPRGVCHLGLATPTTPAHLRSDDEGRRRSTRTRMKPLRAWAGERQRFTRVDGGLGANSTFGVGIPTVVGPERANKEGATPKTPIWGTSGKARRKRPAGGDGDREPHATVDGQKASKKKRLPKVKLPKVGCRPQEHGPTLGRPSES